MRAIAKVNRKDLLLRKQTYSYLSPIDKPILSLCLNSLSELSAELMQLSFIQSAGLICPEVSVFGGAIVFRLMTEGVCTILRGFKFKGQPKEVDYVERKEVSGLRPALRWTHKLFIVDGVRDYQFYGLNSTQINKIIHLYFRPSVLFANLANIYLCLNFLRGAHYLISDTTFQDFCLSAAYLPSLSIHDPYFLSPLLVTASTYLMLRYSRHPFLVHMTQQSNTIHCLNLAFMAGLVMVPVPGIYHFACCGLVVGHLGIRATRYFLRDSWSKIRRDNKQ